MKQLFNSKEQKLNEYKDYIINCTDASKSSSNYSDFSRLDSLIKNRFSDFKGVLEYEDSYYLQDIYDELSKIDSFIEFKDNKANEGKDFKHIGNGQYHLALLTYIRFLRAASIFRCKEDPNNSGAIDTRQVIYYGAPGTGKSHAIEVATEGQDVIRTTFHPDSDYSTFVGAYKPTTKEVPVRNMAGKVIQENGEPVKENRIVYEFVNQAFLQAYVAAWKKLAENQAETKRQYLVIEEINRGNCAQIFGDLFQLLDRNSDGFSEYPIKADADMKKQLNKQLGGLTIENPDIINALYKGKDIVRQVLDGDILLLPSNLYIWATMNTSDQSLFPIDSAFKRRWDWKYIPIRNVGKEYRICVGGILYDWWSFLDIINKIIGDTTSSEDKKLGYFFAKANNGIISAEQFVGKVLFYLWNDVFGNYGFEDDIFTKPNNEKYAFSDFFLSDGTPDEGTLQDFLNPLKIDVDVASENDDDDNGENGGKSPKRVTVIVNGKKYVIGGGGSADKIVEALCQLGKDRLKDILTSDENKPIWSNRCRLIDDKPLPETDDQETVSDRVYNHYKSSVKPIGNTGYYVVTYPPQRNSLFKLLSNVLTTEEFLLVMPENPD